MLLAKLCWILWNCVKSCWFHEVLWNSLAFSKVLLDFMKYFAFSEFHEILMLLMKYIMKSIMKSDGFHMNLCWISWEHVAFNKILLDSLKSCEISVDFSEILINFMKSFWILCNPVNSCWFYEIILHFVKSSWISWSYLKSYEIILVLVKLDIAWNPLVKNS